MPKTKARPDDPRLTAGTLLRGAIDFADVADAYAVRRAGTDRNHIVLTFVIARALELALKAVLRQDGETEDRLRTYFSHDAGRAYRAVLDAHSPPKLRLTARRAQALRLLGRYYRSEALGVPDRREIYPAGALCSARDVA